MRFETVTGVGSDRIGPDAGHGLEPHRASPRRPRQTTQLDTHARKLDRGGPQGDGPGFDLGTDRPVTGSSAKKAAFDRLGTILSELRSWQPTRWRRILASRFHSWQNSETTGVVLARQDAGTFQSSRPRDCSRQRLLSQPGYNPISFDI